MRAQAIIRAAVAERAVITRVAPSAESERLSTAVATRVFDNRPASSTNETSFFLLLPIGNSSSQRSSGGVRSRSSSG